MTLLQTHTCTRDLYNSILYGASSMLIKGKEIQEMTLFCSLKNRHRLEYNNMTYPYDLVAIDVDGTLINSENHLTEATKAAVREVLSKNIGVTLVSGRARMTMVPFLTELGLTLPFISSGGAHIIDPVSNKTLYYSEMPKNVLSIIVEHARTAQAPIIFQESDRIFYEGSQEVLQYLSETYKIDITVADEFKANFIQTDDILQAHIEPVKVYMCHDPVIVQGIEAKLAQYHLPIYMTYSAPPYLEITSASATKGKSIQRLAAHLHIPLERILAIGDSRNDLSMFEVVGKRVAMGNGAPELKAAADLIALSNDEDGVAWTLRNIVLEEA
jgi:Cof subfamily protein (haloacid dehalogenase superfamily)